MWSVEHVFPFMHDSMNCGEIGYMKRREDGELMVCHGCKPLDSMLSAELLKDKDNGKGKR